VATFTLDIPNRRLITADTEILIQEIVNAARGFEDRPEMMGQPIIASIATSGKNDLGGGLQVGITLTLENDWRLYATPRAGPSWTEIVVRGGNLVASNSFSNNPIENTAFNNWQIRQAVSAAIVETAQSGLTPDEALDLAKIRKAFLNAQHVLEGTTANFKIWDDGADPDVDPPLYTQDVTDKDGNAVQLPEGAPAKRSEIS
jgi:hypothetical protein